MNLWEAYRDEIESVKCSKCSEERYLYRLDDELYCETCLKEIEVETDERLSLYERNA